MTSTSSREKHRAGLARTFLRATLVALLLTTAAAQAQTVTVAVVRDGPGEGAELVENIRGDLARHLPRGTEAVLRDDPAWDAGWDPEQAAVALGAALADPGVDLVLLTGPLATVAASDPELELGKPVVSAFVQRSDPHTVRHRLWGLSAAVVGARNLTSARIPPTCDAAHLHRLLPSQSEREQQGSYRSCQPR